MLGEVLSTLPLPSFNFKTLCKYLLQVYLNFGIKELMETETFSVDIFPYVYLRNKQTC